MKKSIVLPIFVLCMILPHMEVHAEDDGVVVWTSDGRWTKKIPIKPRLPQGPGKRMPVMNIVLDCEISTGCITFLSFLSEDGFQVEIESIDGSQWSGLVSPESPSIAFDGEGGVYTIVCTALDGRVYEGEFEL